MANLDPNNIQTINEVPTIIGTNDDDTISLFSFDNDGLMVHATVNHIDGGDGEDTLIFSDAHSFQFINYSNINGRISITTTDNHQYVIEDIEQFRFSYSYSDPSIPVTNTGYGYLDYSTSQLNQEMTGYNRQSDSDLIANDPEINATSEDDTIYVGFGEHIVNGLAGNDFIQSSRKNDTLSGGEGDDTLKGGDGNDTLNGDSGSDIIYFSNGNNTIDGGNGNDTLLFESNEEIIQSYRNENGVITLSGYNGTNTLSNIENFTFNYYQYTPETGETTKVTTTYTIAEFEAMFNTSDQQLNGTNNQDELNGSYGNDTINGLDGNDILHGRSGNDIINGGAGDDTLDGNYGDDVLNGGIGNDTILISHGNDIVDGGEGTDTLDFNFSSLFGVLDYSNNGNQITITTDIYGTETATNIEYIKFGELTFGLDFFDKAFSDQNQTIEGTSLHDFIWGGNGNDTIYGFEGNDAIDGRDGDDTIYGGSGADIIKNAKIVYGGDDNDDITGIGQLYGEAGNDTINAHGNSTVDGGAGDDLIFVRSGEYVIEGGEGNDVVFIPFGSQGPFPELSGDPIALQNISKQKNGGYLITTDSGTYAINNIESIALSAYRNRSFHTPDELLSEKTIPTVKVNGNDINPNAYQGPVDYLDYEFIGESSNDIIVGSLGNDFFNLKDGDDAAEGGVGDDVLDGGSGSNFLTGGQGNDTFFLDGRGGEITWSTITDFNGDEVNIWGWNEGVSKLISSEDVAGADGFKGATLHYDLNDDGTIDTSITFSGLALSELPASSTNVIEQNGYLLFN